MGRCGDGKCENSFLLLLRSPTPYSLLPTPFKSHQRQSLSPKLRQIQSARRIERDRFRGILDLRR